MIVGYQGKFVVRGPYGFLGSIKIGSGGVLECIGKGICGGDDSEIVVGYDGTFKTDGDLSAKRIEINSNAVVEVAGELNCQDQLLIRYNARLLTFGAFTCKRSIAMNSDGVVEVDGQLNCEDKLSIGNSARLRTSGNLSCTGKVSLESNGSLQVDQDASFGHEVQIGYGARLEVRGKAKFARPVILNRNGTITVKMDTSFPEGSQLHGWIIAL